MIVYIDTSVLIRIVLNQPGQLGQWDEIIIGVTSELTRVETYRTLHRHSLTRHISQQAFELGTTRANDILGRMEIAQLSADILRAAMEPLPVPLGTLDALHLATAILYRDAQPDDEPPIRIATHDVELARAAHALKFDVIGV